MDFKTIADQVTKLANLAAGMIPGASTIGAAVKIGDKILDLVDAVSAHVTPDQQAELQEARGKLAEAVKAKADATSKRLRG